MSGGLEKQFATDCEPVDAAEIDAAEIDVPEINVPEIEAPEIDAAEIDAAEIDAALVRGAVLLTPNKRAARRCGAAFDRARHAGNESTWRPAAILPWHAWTASLLHGAIVQGTETRVLLNGLQEEALWRRVLQDGGLSDSHALVRLCMSAITLLGSYDCDSIFSMQHDGQNASIDERTFAGWYRSFETLCARERYLPSSYLDVELAALLRQGKLMPAAEYILYGFDRFTPAQELMIGALRSAGAHVKHFRATTHETGSPALIKCHDGRHETLACASWTRQKLSGDPATKVAVLVPDLEDARPELERDFRALLTPEVVDISATRTVPLFEFSTGRPLSRLPMIAGGMRLLRWCTGAISLEDAGAVLRSPYFSFAPSADRGAELDTFVLRRHKTLRAAVTMNSAANAVSTKEQSAGDHLRRLAKEARVIERQSTYADAADSARALLRTAGWPSRGELNSEEYQAVARWEEALDRIATLDLLGARVGFAEFVQQLSALLRETAFAPENTAAPIQIMTVSEAAGSTADALWFLHADENTWPGTRQMHPFLPVALQRELGMPGSDPGRDERAAAVTLQRIVAGAGEIRFSYAAHTNSGEQRPSPLVSEAIQEKQAAAAFSGEFASPPPALVKFQDPGELPQLPDGDLFGGVGVLAAQAQCGFRAFAEKRLFSTSPEARETGLTPGERGEQVHKVLQAFWGEVKNSDELYRRQNSRPDGKHSERDVTLRRCIAEVMPTPPEHGWDAAYLDVQRERLFKLLSLWLDFEATRPTFAVAAMELEIEHARIGPLQVKLRADRIDAVETSDGRKTLLMDYKTGRATASEWKGERPDSPQLPVYAVAGVEAGAMQHVDGLAFGAVRVGKDGMKLDGLSDHAELLPKRKTDISFDEQVSTWRFDLQRLATAFADGDASVLPKDYPKTCDLCAQRILCRVDSASLLQLEDADLDEAEEMEQPLWR